MKIFRKAITVMLILLMITLSSFTAFAAELRPAKTWRPKITVDKAAAVNGDSVFIGVNISSDNEYIWAFTFSVVYDNTALSYEGFHRGILTDYYVVDHGTHVTLISCGNGHIKADGTMITFQFKIKDTAKHGFYPVTIASNRIENGDNLTGCFANVFKDKIVPVVVNGGVEVSLTQDNCRHKYSKWEAAVEATCLQKGVDVRICSVCNKNETREADKLQHIYEDTWTVDVEATKDIQGIMSRHCKNCDAKTDHKSFDYNAVVDNEISNEVGSNVDKEVLQENNSGTITSTEKPEEETLPNKDIETDKIEADELISLKKDEKIGIAGKIYNYLFGSANKKGLFEIFLDAFKKFLKGLFK